MARLRYGHAGTDAREAFIGAIDAYWEHGLRHREPLPAGPYKVISALWNCADILPSYVYDQVREIAELHFVAPPKRSTYAAAARAISALPISD